MQPSKLEYDKDEITIQVDHFDKPKTLSGVAAWSQLISNLIFTIPGTYPSLPKMGVGLPMYEYEDLNTALVNIRATINEQVKTYLPQLPLASLNVTTMEASGTVVLVIAMSFIYNGTYVSSAIAADTNNFINFDITWE